MGNVAESKKKEVGFLLPFLKELIDTPSFALFSILTVLAPKT